MPKSFAREAIAVSSDRPLAGFRAAPENPPFQPPAQANIRLLSHHFRLAAGGASGGGDLHEKILGQRVIPEVVASTKDLQGHGVVMNELAAPQTRELHHLALDPGFRVAAEEGGRVPQHSYGDDEADGTGSVPADSRRACTR